MFRACFFGQASPVPVTAPPRGAPSVSHADYEGTGPVYRESPNSQPEASGSSGSAEALQHASNPSPTSADSQPSTPGTTRQLSTIRLNAKLYDDLQAESVQFIEPQDLTHGLRLRQRELGRGTYGIVVSGTYRGAACAVKVMLSHGLDRAALRELLVAPSLVYPNVVPTFMSRCAPLDDAFFDFLEKRSGEGERQVERDPNMPRMLEPVPVVSGDGFGDPTSSSDGPDPLLVLHQLLHALEAKTNHMAVVTVSQFCDRGTLDGAIRKCLFRPSELWNARLARRALLRTAAEMARGLQHLHDAGVVHGDFKPANVLLHSARDDRRGFTAKVADFGLSHVLPLSANSIVTDSWGSVAYMAPEAFTGKVSRATDVWAYGVCLWEMCTGKRPFTNMRQQDVVQGVREGSLQLEWPEGCRDDPLVQLARRCLSLQPEARPSFDVIVEELVRIERIIRAELLARQQAVAAAKAAAEAEAAKTEAAAAVSEAAAAPSPAQRSVNRIDGIKVL